MDWPLRRYWMVVVDAGTAVRHRLCRCCGFGHLTVTRAAPRK